MAAAKVRRYLTRPMSSSGQWAKTAHKVYQALYPALKPIFERIAAL